MNRTKHDSLSVGLSVLAGVLFAFMAAICEPVFQPYDELILIALAVGAIVGFLLSPIALFARWDQECRLSFLWVVVPTALLIFVTSYRGDAWVAFLVSVPTYISASVIVGVLAMPRRRRLNWHSSGYCSTCGYDVRGLEDATCPECGEMARLKPKARVPARVTRP